MQINHVALIWVFLTTIFCDFCIWISFHSFKYKYIKPFKYHRCNNALQKQVQQHMNSLKKLILISSR